jgi:hypothetical protein
VIRSGSIGLAGSEVYTAGESIYGGGRKGAEITKGILIDGDNTEKGLYNIAHGYHKARRHAILSSSKVQVVGYIQNPSTSSLSDANAKLLRFDPDVLASTTEHYVVRIKLNDAAVGLDEYVTEQNVFATSLGFITGTNDYPKYAASSASGSLASEPAVTSGNGLKLVKRLSRVIRSGSDDARYLELVINDTNNVVADASQTLNADAGLLRSGVFNVAISIPTTDGLEGISPATSFQDPGTALGLLKNNSFMEEAGPDRMPELRIIVNSLMINTESRKLRASWTPELSQDLNAYHNIDAEVELTNLLSEQISQELDQLLLNDLLKGATAGTYYWSRRPGKFVNRTTGADLIDSSSAANYAAPPDFTGNVSMWYETLIETINDLSAQIQRKTLRGGATFIVCGPEVANILEFTAGFRASATHSEEKGSIGVVNVGSISKKFDVMVSTYFPRNVILVGRKGSGFLESGYVYSPYVPLQMTPTVFDPDNFTPRKAVMTRFGRKMVRPDMYGLVIVRDLLG